VSVAKRDGGNRNNPKTPNVMSGGAPISYGDTVKNNGKAPRK
jgi:hypothetical protein